MRNKKGFTLVETIFVAALFPIIAIALYTVVTMAGVLYNTSLVYAEVNQDHMQTLRSLLREVGESSHLSNPSRLTITTDGNGNSILTFQVPVDWDGDGDVVTSDLDPETEWGAYNDVGNWTSSVQDGWIRYQVTNNQLVRDVLSSGSTAISGTERVIMNNVQTFTATQVLTKLNVSLTFQASEDIGQDGQARNISSSLSSSTLLRNAVT